MAIGREKRNIKTSKKESKTSKGKNKPNKKVVEIKPFSDSEEQHKKDKKKDTKSIKKQPANPIIKKEEVIKQDKSKKAFKKPNSIKEVPHKKSFNSSRDVQIKERKENIKKGKSKDDKPERGPTKRELREELSKGKKNMKGRKEKDIKAPTNAKVENTEEIKKKEKAQKFQKEKKPRPVKKQKENSTKFIYTKENINACLLDVKSSPTKDKATNMLLFVLKTFKANPPEVLAKVKILTCDKSIDCSADSVQIAVLRNICHFYGLNETPMKNLFSMMKSEFLLAKYLSDFIFASAFENEQYDAIFEDIFDEICKTTEKSATLPFRDFIGFFYEIDSHKNLEEYKGENEIIGKGNDKIKESTAEEKKIKEGITESDVLHEEGDLLSEESGSSESSIDLISLSDDAEIIRLDSVLGKMFGKGVLSIEEQKYAGNLAKCLELLVKSNFCVKIENLIRILYLSQIDCLSQTVKFITKHFLAKVCDKERIFRIFQITALISPSIYSLYSLFIAYCGDAFDLKKFLICCFNFGHEELIANKVNKDDFYSLYDRSYGSAFDDFFIILLQNERRVDKLKELESNDFDESIKNAIKEALLTVDSKKEKQLKVQKN